jgi:hypothetical protein
MGNILQMKFWILILLVIISCQTLRQEKGSISKQVDLIEDICRNPNLDPDTQKRCTTGLNNIRESEKAKDSDILQANKEAKRSNQIAIEKTEAAGKWDGARNVLILIGIGLALILGLYIYIRGSIPKIPFIN